MTTRRKTGMPRLRITQVHSIIGNQERVKKVVTDGLGLGRIGASVVLVDNSYTRGMIAKTAHIVKFEEVAAEIEGHKAEHSQLAVPEAVERLVEAVVAPIEKAPYRKKAVDEEAAKPPETAHKTKPATKAKAEPKAKAGPKGKTGTKTASSPARKRTAAKSEE